MLDCQPYIYLVLLVLLKAALVVDPVMVSTSGDTLSESSTLSVYRYRIHIWFVLFVFITSGWNAS